MLEPLFLEDWNGCDGDRRSATEASMCHQDERFWSSRFLVRPPLGHWVSWLKHQRRDLRLPERDSLFAYPSAHNAVS